MKGHDMLIIKGETKSETQKQNEIILGRGVKENQQWLKIYSQKSQIGTLQSTTNEICRNVK